MTNVSISEFRANLLKYLKIVQRGEQLNVTSKGTPLATLTAPINQLATSRAQLKKLAKTAIIHDVLSPTDESWDAME